MPLGVTLATILTIAAKIREFLANPLVNKSIDNFVARTPTVLDEKVWNVIEILLGLDDQEEAISMVREKLARIQLEYSQSDDAGKEFLKSPAPSGPVFAFSKPILLADVPGIHAPVPDENVG